jgi:hypothetical protein
MEQAGYEHFIVKPVPDMRFAFAQSKHHSNYGDISVRWEMSEEEFSLMVTVPANTSEISSCRMVKEIGSEAEVSIQA